MRFEHIQDSKYRAETLEVSVGKQEGLPVELGWGWGWSQSVIQAENRAGRPSVNWKVALETEKGGCC